MAAVIDWLQAGRKARVVVTTGPATQELALARRIVSQCQTKPLFFAGDLTLGQIAALSAESDGYFGVDTAPMHMAAAVGVPVVALFGPTNPRNWRPWQARGEVLAKHCPCNDPRAKEKCDWTQVRACLAAITVPEAEAALDRMLALPGKREAASTLS
jgi:heptosyltransferase-3